MSHASRLQRGASGERKTTEALARLHFARSLNHSHCFTAEGWGASLTPLGLRSFKEIMKSKRQKQEEAIDRKTKNLRFYFDLLGKEKDEEEIRYLRIKINNIQQDIYNSNLKLKKF